MNPKSLLRLEGAAVFLAMCFFYNQLHGSWFWFAVLLLTPDFFMLGYLANKKVGAFFYNLIHTYSVPALVLSGLGLSGLASYSWLVLIWFAHIGMDRMAGYGLKYESSFKDTHLQRL